MIVQEPQAELTSPTVVGSNILPDHQQTVAIVLAAVILVVVLDLVRKRKLREEYSILWIVTAIALLAMAIETDLLVLFQRAVGAVLPVSALFFGALLFLMLVALQYSVRLSKLTARNKTLCQKLALLERDLDTLRRELHDELPRPPAKSAVGVPERIQTSKTEAS
ncbi:MAG: DUF2304 domain-containing protein [Planctomycetes bacterium]|nr:DUF2304 domain-containing protein [Planctomycetota bacterium]